jgi:hypothetical protein
VVPACERVERGRTRLLGRILLLAHYKQGYAKRA